MLLVVVIVVPLRLQTFIEKWHLLHRLLLLIWCPDFLNTLIQFVQLTIVTESENTMHGLTIYPSQTFPGASILIWNLYRASCGTTVSVRAGSCLWVVVSCRLSRVQFNISKFKKEGRSRCWNVCLNSAFDNILTYWAVRHSSRALLTASCNSKTDELILNGINSMQRKNFARQLSACRHLFCKN